MNKFSKALITVFAIGSLPQSCELIHIADEVLMPNMQAQTIENRHAANHMTGILDQEIIS